MKSIGIVLLTMCAVAAASAVPVKIADSAFEASDGGKSPAWKLSPGMSIRPGAGHNGSGGLVWESVGPNIKQDAATQNIPLEHGKAYTYSALVRTEGFKSRKYGATLSINWYDAKRKWIAGAYVKGVTEENSDWKLIRGVTRNIPENAATVSVTLFITAGCSGRAYFDNVLIEPVDRNPVAFVFSSAYRNLAAKGKVRFHASLYRPESERATKAMFVRRDASGVERRVSPTVEVNDGATLEVNVDDLPMGNSEISCELQSADGRVLGRAACSFKRVAELPKRRVWIDEHKRCILDGKPFFPLGMYCGKIDEEMLAQYSQGPFNVVMSYAPTGMKELDLLHERGIMMLFSLRSHLLGSKWAERMKVTRQDEVDAFYEREIRKRKDHPALLGWYVCDEAPATEIPDRTHIYGVFTRTDPDHPTWAVLDRTYDLREFIPIFDVLGMDPYPIGRKPLSHVTDLVRETKKAVFNDVALWNVPQTFDWGWFRKDYGEKDLRFPTEAEIANMNWQHIALGANGLIAYNFHSLKRDCDPRLAPEYWRRIRGTFEPIKRLFPVLLSVEPAPAVDNAPEMMSVRTWVKDGKLYVLAVNPLREGMSASLSVSGGNWSFAGVMAGAVKKAAVDGRRIDLELDPVGFAMLRLDPCGRDAP